VRTRVVRGSRQPNHEPPAIQLVATPEDLGCPMLDTTGCELARKCLPAPGYLEMSARKRGVVYWTIQHHLWLLTLWSMLKSEAY
jgi:hypothetical protein